MRYSSAVFSIEYFFESKKFCLEKISSSLCLLRFIIAFNNSSSEPEVNGSDSESESGDNPELDRDESAGTDGESGYVPSGEENEEIKEEEKVEEESDDESDIDLEKELEEGFDEVEKENW